MPDSFVNQDMFVIADPDLENLLRQLQPGMTLTGRIIRSLNSSTFILRIRGYNIITQANDIDVSDQSLRLRVVQVRPHLILKFKKSRFGIKRNYNHIEGYI